MNVRTAARMIVSVLAAALIAIATPAVAGPQHPAVAATSVRPSKHKLPRCRRLEDRFARSLPGVVANCYALRKWKQGRYSSAIHDYRLAAAWGSKKAQRSLGLIYFTGRHVPADKALGLAWLQLASERHDDDRTDLVARSAQALATPAQQQRARQLLAQLSLRYADKVAAERAWKRYQHVRRYRDIMKMVEVVPTCQKLPAGTKGAFTGMQQRCRYQQMNAENMKQLRDTLVAQYFHGWRGIVTVGALQSGPAAATSSGK